MDPNSYTGPLLRHAAKKARERELERRRILRSIGPDMAPRSIADFERQWTAEEAKRQAASRPD